MLATRTAHRQDDVPLGPREMEPRNRTGLRRDTPRHEVLVVDDDPSFAEVVAEGLQDEDIVPIVVSDPREALKLAGERPFAVAVLDLVMPGIDGLELSRQLRKKSPELEVVLLTGHVSIHSAIEGIRNEVFDYFQKTTLNPIRLRRAVRAAIARREMRQAESRSLPAGWLGSVPRTEALVGQVLEMLVRLLDSQDATLAGRSRTVAALADRAARRLGMSEEERRMLRLAALLHEVDKLQPGPAVLELLPILDTHRERWDGKGGPRGLRGEQIPLGARILAVAEAFEALARSSPCALGRAPVEALGELKAQGGTRFDPRVIQAFVEEHRVPAIA